MKKTDGPVDPNDEVAVIVNNLYAQSHIIAWAIFVPGMFVYILLKCIGSCLQVRFFCLTEDWE